MKLTFVFRFFSECPRGKFGSNCQRKCHCADNSKCSNVNGYCIGGICEKGYTGGNCQTSKIINSLYIFSRCSEMNILSI